MSEVFKLKVYKVLKNLLSCLPSRCIWNQLNTHDEDLCFSRERGCFKTSGGRAGSTGIDEVYKLTQKFSWHCLFKIRSEPTRTAKKCSIGSSIFISRLLLPRGVNMLFVFGSPNSTCTPTRTHRTCSSMGSSSRIYLMSAWSSTGTTPGS
jgi:hypothetical protein